MYFVGIDLAWQSNRNPTGGVILEGDADGVDVTRVSPALRSYSEVQGFLLGIADEPAYIAVDAPLVIRNSSGLRTCEREVGRRYGNRHASCHASNLTLYPEPLSVQLADWLQSRGYYHAADRLTDRTLLEVYPHAAFVALFDLPQIIRYKKGRVSEKVRGLRTVQETIRRLGSEAAPLRMTSALDEFLAVDVAILRGQQRKEYEDSLDALFCAYLAYYLWRWGFNRSEVFGTSVEGYIVNPKLRTNYSTTAAT